MELVWLKHVPVPDKGDVENLPLALWGHSMTAVGLNAFVYGGIEAAGSRDGDAGIALEEQGSRAMFILRMAVSSLVWERVPQGFDTPKGRWRHTASLVRGSEIVVFGGSHSLDERLCDTHVFDCISRKWRLPRDDFNTDPSTFRPSARASHSAAVSGETVLVFGGYGGSGKSRRHFNDVLALDTVAWRWSALATTSPPQRRSGHEAQVVEQRMYVFGGASAAESFADVWSLDLSCSPATWRQLHGATLPSPSWAMSSCSVPSIPSAKVFLFGGMLGPLLDSGIGETSALLAIFDSELERWSLPAVSTTKASPTRRCDSALVMDAKNSRLVLCGGWADRWLGDVWSADVSKLIGPPYIVTGLSPCVGPITGGTRVTVLGVDFFNTRDIVVCFGHGKTQLQVPGVFESQSAISCTTPDFNVLGQVSRLDVRVALDGDAFTTTSQTFDIFTVTCARNCIMFGPGLLSGCAIKDEVSFIVLARDNVSRNRTGGGDEFGVAVYFLKDGGEDEAGLPRLPGVTVKDRGDGRYLVRYSARYPGKYLVKVDFMGTFGGLAGPIRGSPAAVQFDEFASRNNNVMAGALMIRALKEDILAVKSAADDLADRIFVNLHDQRVSDEERIRMIVGVSDAVAEVEPMREDMQLRIDRSEAVLEFLKERSTVVPGVDGVLQQGKEQWAKITHEKSRVLDELAPLMVANAGKIRADIFAFQNFLSDLKADLMQCDFVRFESGYDRAIESLRTSESELEDQQTALKKVLGLARVFGVMSDTSGVSALMAESKAFLRDHRLYWECLAKVQQAIGSFRKALWTSDVAHYDEDTRALTVTAHRLPPGLKRSSLYAELERTLDGFVHTCRFALALHSPCMRERHWLDLMRITQTMIPLPEKTPDFTFGHIAALNLTSHSGVVEELIARAEAESRHEDAIGKVQSSWQKIEFSMLLFRDTEVPVLQFGSATEQLDGDLVALGQVLRSRYGHFHKKATEWQSTLTSLLGSMLLLDRVQRLWCLVQPLFETEEIRLELPSESKAFREADSSTRFLLTRMWKNKAVIKITKESGIGSKLVGIVESLETCKQSLWDFLDRKRMQFPRLYFVSDDVLLAMVSHSSQPAKVLHFIQRVFSGVAAVALDRDVTVGSSRPSALSWSSSCGQETILFEKPLPLDGHFHQYLTSMEHAQRQVLRRKTKEHLHRYLQLSRELWAIEKDDKGQTTCPAQVTLLVAHIFFTRKVEHAFFSIGLGDADALLLYSRSSQGNLTDLVRLAMTKLMRADRLKVENLILLDAHHIDVVQALVATQTSSALDYAWLSKLRFKPDHDESDTRSSRGLEVECSLVIGTFFYGFEYIGDGSRVAVTPITERVYLVIGAAMSSYQCSIVVGGHGVGKAASVESFSLALGTHYVCIDGANAVTSQLVERAVRASAMCGTWALFRNIQSMDRLTLSVLGSCVSVVLKAIAAGSAKVVVGSSIIPVLPTCGFISAMLSSELQFTPIPESLRAIFRPCSILVPDVKVICEYFLLKAGFAAPRPTAASLCCLFATSPHVLGQSADAWNLRAMKHILDVLGPLRRSEAYVDVDDLGLVLRAARDLILPKLDRVETEVFTGLLASVFPFTSASRVMDEALADYVAHACDDIGLWADKEFSDNVLQLDELMDAFPAVVVAGPPCSAKSSIWKALLLARAKQNESSDKRAIVLYARLFSLESLYGSVDSSGEWVDGCLTRTLRNIDDADNTLLVLDGVMEVSVTERLRPLLRGPRSLLLPTHEVVSLPSRVGVLLETTDLSSASPAFLAHCGVLALANAGGGLRTSIFGSWVRCRPHEIFDLKAKENVFRLAEKYLTTSIQGLRTYVDNLNEASLALRLSKFLEVLLLPRAMLHQLTLLENVFVFALVWACGSCLMTATNSRAQFSEWFRKAFPDVKFPNAGSIFDYSFNADKGIFESWKACQAYAEPTLPRPRADISSLYMPTLESAAIEYFSEKLLNEGTSVAVVGREGCGKSSLVRRLLASKFPYTTLAMNSLRGCSYCSRLIRLSPPAHGAAARNVIFIEDLEMAGLGPLELLRQVLQRAVCFDFDTQSDVDVLGKSLVCCAEEKRCANFHVLTWTVPLYLSLSASSLGTILNTIITSHLVTSGFSGEYLSIAKSITKISTALAEQLESTYVSSPNVLQYRFSSATLFRIFRGLHFCTLSCCDEPVKLILFWLHEVMRTVVDVLSAVDRERFLKSLGDTVKKEFSHFHVSKYFSGPAHPEAETILFSHLSSDLDAGSLVCEKVDSVAEARASIAQQLADDAAFSGVILFDDAVVTVLKVARALALHNEGLLMVGPDASGKALLVRLASFLFGMTTRQLDLDEGYSDLKFRADWLDLVSAAVLQHEKMVVLISEIDIADDEVFVSLFELMGREGRYEYPSDFKENILSQLPASTVAQGGEGISAWRRVEKGIQDSIFICVTATPSSSSMRRRAMQFDKVFGATQVLWLEPLPVSAYSECCRESLRGSNLDVVDIFGDLSIFFEKVLSGFLSPRAKQRSLNLRTLTELLSGFHFTARNLFTEAEFVRDSLIRGLQRLDRAEDDTQKIQENTKAMADAAQGKLAATETLRLKLHDESGALESELAKLKAVEHRITVLDTAVSLKTAETRSLLVQGDPFLDIANGALELVNRQELGDLAVLTKPPDGVEEVFAAITVLLAGKLPQIFVQKSGRVKERDRSWSKVKTSVLGNINAFIEELTKFRAYAEEGSLHKVNLREVRQYLLLETFKPDVVERGSEVAGALCAWVINIVAYCDVIDSVEPFRLDLDKLKSELGQRVHDRLAIESEISIMTAKKEKLTALYTSAAAASEEALRLTDNSELKLELARKLLAELASERRDWSERAKQIDKEHFRELATAAAMSSALKTLSGVMDPSERHAYFQELRTAASVLPSLVVDEHKQLIDYLCSVGQVSDLALEGLVLEPCFESAALVLNAPRIPVLADPRKEALQWIKRRHPSVSIVAQNQRELATRLGAVAASRAVSVVLIDDGSVCASLFAYCRRRRNSGRDVAPLYLHSVARRRLPNELSSMTAIISFETDGGSAVTSLLNDLTKSLRSSIYSYHFHIRAGLALGYSTAKELQDTLLSFLAGQGGDTITSDKALIHRVFDTRQRLLEVEKGIHKLEESLQHTLATICEFEPIARTGARLFMVSERMLAIDPDWSFSFQSLSRFLVEGVRRAMPQAAHAADVVHIDTKLPRETDTQKLFDLIEKLATEAETQLKLESREEGQKARALKSAEDEAVRSVYTYLSLGAKGNDRVVVAALFAFERDPAIPSVSAFIDILLEEGPASETDSIPTWASRAVWMRMHALEEAASKTDGRFLNFVQKVVDSSSDWRQWFEGSSLEVDGPPAPFDVDCPWFIRLLLVRTFRPDCLVKALRSYVGDIFTADFLQIPDNALKHPQILSTKGAPVILVKLRGEETSGRFPTIRDACESVIDVDPLRPDTAIARVVAARDEGMRILVDGFELLNSATIAEIVDCILHQDATPHGFQLYCTIDELSIARLPEELRCASTVVYGVPHYGVVPSLTAAWSAVSERDVHSTMHPALLTQLLLALCFVQAVAHTRDRYQPLAWTLPHNLGPADFDFSRSLLTRLCTQLKAPTLNEVQNCLQQIGFSGCFGSVLDENIVADLFRVAASNVAEKGRLAEGVLLPELASMDFIDMRDFLGSISLGDECAVVGLARSAGERLAYDTATYVLHSFEPHGSTCLVSSHENTSSKVSVVELLRRVPPEISGTIRLRLGEDKSKTFASASLRTETKLMNVLISLVKTSLTMLINVLDSRERASEKLIEIQTAVFRNAVPLLWREASWPRDTPLSTWLTTLAAARDQLQVWNVSESLPEPLALNLLLCPQLLLVSLRQSAAADASVPMDAVDVNLIVTTYFTVDDVCVRAQLPAKVGVLVSGIRVCGSDWDCQSNSSAATEVHGLNCGGALVTKNWRGQYVRDMPFALLVGEVSGVSVVDEGIFSCPLYRTAFQRSQSLMHCSLRTEDASMSILSNTCLSFDDPTQ